MDIRRVLTFLPILLSHFAAGGVLTPEQSRALQEACPQYQGCSAQNGNVLKARNPCCLACSCDLAACTSDGTCCPDVNENYESTGRTESISEKTDSSSDQLNINGTLITSNETSQKVASLKCVSPTIGLTETAKSLVSQGNSVSRSHIGAFMVTSCADGNDTKCINPSLFVLNESTPVYSAENDRTYRNIFCAFCDHQNETKLYKWKPYITCSDLTNVLKAYVLLFPADVNAVFSYTAKQDHQTCGIDFLPPDEMDDNKLELCFPKENVISNCLEVYENSSLEQACKSFLMPYVRQENSSALTNIYANYFCFLCNNGSTDDNYCPSNMKFQIHENSDLVAELNADDRNHSSLMPPWLQTDLTPSSYIPSGVKCKQRTTYDPFKEKCRDWYCPDGRYYADAECLPFYTHVIKASYSITLKITPDTLTSDTFKYSNLSILTDQVLRRMFGEDESLSVDVIVLSVRDDYSFLYTFVLLHVNGHTNFTRSLFDETTYGNDVTVMTDNGTVTVKVEFSAGLKLELNTYPLSDIVVIDFVNYVALQNVYRVDIEKVKDAFRFPTISKLSFCSQIIVQRNEIFEYIDVFDISVSHTRIYVGEFARASQNGEYIICLSDYLRDVAKYIAEKNKSEEYTPQAILSVICSMLSMAGLLITILTYIIFDELRSIPGKNNMMLALHLLVAQCFYQFGMDQTDSPRLCIALGMFIHLFWLTAIFWMNACTLHMFRTFVTGQSYRSVRALDPQVCCYALYCYSIAVLMVAVNIGVSMYQSNGKEVGYGGRLCYISNPVMVGWVFALPVGVIIILNMGFFFAVVYQISASTMRRRGKSTDRANTVIYMKLSSLTGVTWIFGYLYLWTDFTPLEYIFIVLNAGQGVFIFISFICTQRVTKLYWSLFRRGFRSCRVHACACFCDRKLSDSESHAVDVNTAKISLTASVAKSKRANSHNASTKEHRNVYSGSKEVSNSHSSSDLFRDTARIAHELCNPVPAGDQVVRRNEFDLEFANHEENRAVKDGLQNGINSIAIAAVGIRDIEFISAKH